jgi:cytochrome c oxidase cbb3-type subunit 3
MMGRRSVLSVLAAGLAMASLLLFHGGATAADAPAVGKVMKNPFAGKADAIKEGEAVFDAKCAECHGGDAMGQSGPDLTDDKWVYGGTDTEVFETVTNGRKGGMPSWKRDLSTDDIWKVIAYIRSLSKK